jgi:GNAT superfamily N-acetyltransferase
MIDVRLGLEGMDWLQLTELYAEVGLIRGHGKRRETDKIEQAFRASSKVATAWEGTRLVGAGRMISDGVCYGSVFDVGVLPAWQKRGIGARLVAALVEGSEDLCIHLTSTLGNEPFYAKLGFLRHRTAMARYPHASDYLVPLDQDALP